MRDKHIAKLFIDNTIYGTFPYVPIISSSCPSQLMSPDAEQVTQSN